MESPALESIEQVSDGWLKKYILHYRMADGSQHVYETVSRKGPEAFRAHLEANSRGEAPAAADAVCIVGTTPRDTLVMIREFRYPLNSWCVAFPAGLVDPGEDIARCAERELQEETGYSLLPGTSVKPLPQAGYSSTGMSDEQVHVVFAQVEKTGEPNREPNELIEVFELPLSEIPAFLEAAELPIGTRAQLVLELLKAKQPR